MPAYVCVGIDSADDHHDLEAAALGDPQVLRLRIPNTLEGFLTMEAALRQRFGDAPRHYGMENPTLLLGRYLLQSGAHLHPINPRAVARMREALAASGRKDDALDAQALRRLVEQRLEAGQRPLQRSSPDAVLVAGLVAERVEVVEEKNRVVNQLTAVLKGFYPRALELFSRLDQPLTLTFLERFASPTELQAAPRAEWDACFAGQRYPQPRRLEQLWERAQRPHVAVSSEYQELGARQVRRLARLLRVLVTDLAELDAAITARFQALPEAEIFTSLPGAAQVLAPALFALFGDNRARWQDWRELARQSGTVPVTRTSGRFRGVNMRHHCDHRARRTLHLFAGCSLRSCAWAQEFYRSQRARGKTHGTALRNLATKWLRIIYRLWSDHLRYDEALYEKNRSERRAPRGTANLPLTSS